MCSTYPSKAALVGKDHAAATATASTLAFPQLALLLHGLLGDCAACDLIEQVLRASPQRHKWSIDDGMASRRDGNRAIVFAQWWARSHLELPGVRCQEMQANVKTTKWNGAADVLVVVVVFLYCERRC